MKRNVIFIHGTYGSGKENWFPWLKKKLERSGHKVLVPKFPTPKGQTLRNWLKVFSKFDKFVDNNTIFVCHSIGASFVLRYLETTKKNVKGCFFVAPFVFVLCSTDLDYLFKSFVGDYDYKKIKKRCNKFFIFGSDNDKYVPLEWDKKLKKRLNAKLFILKNAGHINEDAGYLKFPLLFDKIKKLK
ncbi:MAG: serine hydrolase family protein [Candidatus Aenigmarchaeota archaeon]|nr:serine hydrolase family protein [Candidatus Aenigmarchaeota archaeon]